jgi:uncharacterized UPF0160 family protein
MSGKLADPASGGFDHHQRGGAGHRANGVPYASFGLVWQHYGEQCVRTHLGGLLTDGEVLKVTVRVDKMLVQSVDAADNGIDQGPVFSISSVIRQMNPEWYRNPTPGDFDHAFADAEELASDVLRKTIDSAWAAVKSEDIVEDALIEMHENGRQYAALPQYCVWKGHVAQDRLVQFVVFPGATGDWLTQSVPIAPGNQEARRLLLEEWRGPGRGGPEGDLRGA